MIVLICLVGTCITWPILLPVYGTGNGDASGLSVVSFSHLNEVGRYYATCFVAFIFLGKWTSNPSRLLLRSSALKSYFNTDKDS